jgi:hypothetical protein
MALEIADRVRRHRFFSSLPFGGRLTSLRWILEAPVAALDKASHAHRQDLLAAFPQYQALSQRSAEIRNELASLPMVPSDADTPKRFVPLYNELAKVSVQQEAILREIAVRREPAGLVFPPLRTAKELQEALPPGTAMLSFLMAGGDYHAFLLNRDKCIHWALKNPGMVGKRLVSLLREIGNYDQNREVAVKDLADVRWKQSAKQLLDGIVEGSQADFSRKFSELIIVPDGMFWYLPFEMLQVEVDKQPQSLISRFRIRYAPTMGLAIPDERGQRNLADTAVVAGRLYPRDDPAVALAAYKKLAQVVSKTTPLSKPPLPASANLLKTRMQQLIVLDDIGNGDADPFGWTPITLEHGRAGSQLRDWMALPWGGPETMVLPGYHTMAENPNKRTHRGPPGHEMFLASCGLMSTGAKTVLLSRWRTGGQASFDLVREFVQELPHVSAADAWQRAVQVVSDTRLNLQAEPRIQSSSSDEPPKAEHPFLWAGYMLIDPGRAAPTIDVDTTAKPMDKDAKPMDKDVKAKEKQAGGDDAAEEKALVPKSDGPKPAGSKKSEAKKGMSNRGGKDSTKKPAPAKLQEKNDASDAAPQ